jgi:predicted HicB family RNase H-like nuclease
MRILGTDRSNAMSNTMTYKGYSARIEYDDEDGMFTGRLAGISDGVSFHADTVEALRDALHEAVEDYVETCAKIGKEPQRHSLVN